MEDVNKSAEFVGVDSVTQICVLCEEFYNLFEKRGVEMIVPVQDEPFYSQMCLWVGGEKMLFVCA